MTEALIKFLATVPNDLSVSDKWPKDPVAVLSAFVKEINRRENECDNSRLGCPYESRSQCRGDKLRSVVRDFGLDSKEHRQPSADSDFMAANDEEGSK